MINKGHILIVDDEKNYLLILSTMLKDIGYEITTLKDPELVLPHLAQSQIDVVITDMKMPKMTGAELLQEIKKSWPTIPVLVMTAFGSIESAVDAMRLGAFDYITKPFANDELFLSIQNAMKLAEIHQQYQILQETLEERYKMHQVIGKSKQITDILSLIERISSTKSTVLITGESGIGKEMLAKAIHFNSSRKKYSYVSVNCIVPQVFSLEEELFGREEITSSRITSIRKGRVEQASHGTLFLNEVTELSLELQDKLLRVMQDQVFERVGGSQQISIDLRVIASTTRNLSKLVEEGMFREALYYKLNVVHIPIPSLNERREDIPLLISYFAQKIAEENGVEQKEFSQEALNYLIGYEWPRNIRQLQNVLERCVVMTQHRVIGVDDLPPEIKDEESQFKSAVDLLPVEINLADTLDKIEAALVRRAMIRTDYVQSHAAEMLGISRSLIQYKLRKYRISGR